MGMIFSCNSVGVGVSSALIVHKIDFLPVPGVVSCTCHHKVPSASRRHWPIFLEATWREHMHRTSSFIAKTFVNQESGNIESKDKRNSKETN